MENELQNHENDNPAKAKDSNSKMDLNVNGNSSETSSNLNNESESPTKQSEFYEKAKDYWGEIPATVDGMLGGYSHISSTDIAGSTEFLRRYIRGAGAKTKSRRALDCGAGIGRITKRLLVQHFDSVDMVELDAKFLAEAKNYLGEHASKIERFICMGLQDFTPETGRYDVIWCQWVLGHLTDTDLIAFFQRCKAGLADDGIIVVKENFTASDDDKDFDEQDSSFTRSRDLLVSLIVKSGLVILKEQKQKKFPKEIYEVRMFALQ